MSVLVDKLRGLLFSNLREGMPKPLREAAWDLITAVDSDIEIAGYSEDTYSSTTQEAIEKLDYVLQRGELPEPELDEDIPSPPSEDTPQKKDALDIELDEDPIS